MSEHERARASVRTAVETYVRAWLERDPAVRAALLETCFAADGRFVTRAGEIRGRAALAELMARTHANPSLLRIRLSSVIDTGATTFRFRGIGDFADGSSPETLDVGEVDADGRIALVLTFTGPLADLEPPLTS